MGSSTPKCRKCRLLKPTDTNSMEGFEMVYDAAKEKRQSGKLPNKQSPENLSLGDQNAWHRTLQLDGDALSVRRIPLPKSPTARKRANSLCLPRPSGNGRRLIDRL